MANNEPTTFKYTSRYSGEIDVAFTIHEYVMGGVAVEMLSKEHDEWSNEDVWEPYAVITRFILSVDKDEAFVDENNLPGIGEWLESNGLAEATGYGCPSGYCVYPLYKFTPKFFEVAVDRRSKE